VYWVLVGKPEGKRLLERHRHKWEDNIEIDHTEIGWEGMDWICVPQDMDLQQTVVNVVTNCRVP